MTTSISWTWADRGAGFKSSGDRGEREKPRLVQRGGKGGAGQSNQYGVRVK